MTLVETINIKALFDSHAHLAYLTNTNIITLIKSAKEAQLESIFNMGIDIKSSKIVLEQAKLSENYLKAFVGIDPEVFLPGSDLFVGLEKGEEFIDKQIIQLKDLIEQNREWIYGIGETGIDYYHIESANISAGNIEESKKLQEMLFRRHLELAQQLKLPLSIHSRRAEKECLKIAREYNCKGIFHSYTGDYQTAKEILEIGWGLGVNGIVTFKNAVELRETYRKLLGNIPFEADPWYFYKQGIFFETDSPFLSPEGKRGEENKPANVSLIFQKFKDL